MIKYLLISIAVLSSSLANAEATPANAITRSIVNGWTQGGLMVTDKLFDLAIQGNGFFVLKLPNGQNAFSRYGAMRLDPDGYLTYAS